MDVKVKKIIYSFIVFVTVVFGFAFSAEQSFAACPSTGTANCGVFTSQVKDIGFKAAFATLGWSETKPAGTYVTALEVQAGNPTTAGTACSAGVTWDAAWASVANGGSLSAFNGRQCIQYRTTLSSDDVNYVPSLDEVVIGYYPSGELISSPYNTRNYGNQLTAIAWQETKPGTSDVLLQVRTSWDGSSWTSWMGPDGTSNSYFTDPSGGEAIPAALAAGNNDQWIQYKLTLKRDYNDATTPVLMDLTMSYNLAQYSGTFTSQVKDATRSVAWNTLSWTPLDANLPANTSITMRARAGNTATPDGTWTVWTGVTNGGSLSALNGNRYMQYEATLSTFDSSTVPTLDEVVAGYSYYDNNKTLISSPYNTNSSGNVISQISWKQDANLPANTALKFQLQSSPDNITWSGWMGPDGTSASYFYYTSAGDKDSNCADGGLQDGGTTRLVNCAIPAGHLLKVGDNDQWMQYKVFFMTSDGASTASLYDATLTYVANAPPCAGTTAIGPPVVCSQATITASQISNGTIAVTNYPISDAEEASEDGVVNVQFFYDTGVTTPGTGNTGNITVSSSASLDFPSPGYVMIDNEVIQYVSITDGGGANNDTLVVAGRGGSYPISWPETGYTTQASAHSAGSAVWLLATNAAGKGNKTGITATAQNFSATLTPASDLASSGVYYGLARVRVALNDGNAASQVGTVNSGTFTIDTKPPVYGSPVMKIDSTAASATLTNITVTEISTLSVRYANASNIDGSTCAADIVPAIYEPLVGNSKAWVLVPNTNGVSTICFQAKDNFNNISAVTFAANPATPVNLHITDISAVPASKYRDIIWWDVVPDPGNFSGYNVYRCAQATGDSPVKCNDSANYSLLSTISNRATNYCFDEGDGNCTDNALGALVSTTKYFYKVSSEDIDGVSLFSSTVSAIPDGSIIGEAVTDTAAPVLTVPPADTSTAQTSTVIGWTTDEPSYSLVKYGTSSGNLNLIAGNATESVMPHSVALSGLASGTLYYYQILSADATGNLLKSPTDPPAGLYTFTTLSDSTAPSVIGTPSVIAGQTSATISWTTNEASTSRVKYIVALDNTTDPVAGTATALQSELVTNHVVIIPSGLTPDTIYNYQVISADASANSMTYQSAAPFSQFNTATTADITAPTLDVAPSDSGTTQNSTGIGWTTNENSYSIVKYGTNQNNLNLMAGAVTDSATVHSVAIANLAPGTLYYYQIFSADSSGNLLKSPVTPPTGLYTFTTLSDSMAPSLIGLPAVTAGRDSATISWVTDEASTTRLKYVVAVDNTTVPATLTSLQSELVTNHFVILIGLASSTTYNFQIISADAGANTLTSPASSPYLQFSTDFDKADAVPPAITFNEASQGPSVANSSLTDNIASATFSANENAFFSMVYQASTTPPASYSKETGAPSLVTAGMENTVTMEGLIANTKYYYKLRARDLFGNTGELGPYFFTTTSDIIPPSAVNDLDVPAASVASTSLTLTWTAPGDNASVGTAGSYDIRYSTISAPDLSANWNTATQIANEPLPAVSTTPQSMAITGLTPSTTYYFALKTGDEIPNWSNLSNIVSATTPAQLDIIPPVITNVTMGAVGTTTAAISWDTDKNSSSLVDFGLTVSYGNTQGNSSVSAKSHTVNMAGLAPNTKYYYRPKSIDGSGNVGSKEDPSYFFTTQVDASAGTLPIISSVQAASITATSAQITWTTSVDSDSTVGYSVNTSYSYETGVASNLTSHSVTLTNLTPSTAYRYRVKSRNGNQLAVDDNGGAGFPFTTLAGADTIPPVITSVQVTTVTSNKATVTWTTNENSNSSVEFGTLANTYTSVQGNPGDSLTSHSIQLVSLTPATAYYFQVKSTDAAGNRATDNNSGIGYTFSTTLGAAVDCPDITCRACAAPEACPAQDTAAPVISNIKVSDITFSSATITWTTDENANSAVSYDTYSYAIKGGYTYGNSKLKDSTRSHSVTLNNLDSATVYYFRVLSTDARGNTAESADQTFKTPAISESKDKGAAATATLKKQFEDIAKTLVKDNLATEENIRDIISRIANPPVIGSEGPIVKDIKSYGATIIWQTDRKANSIVKFKPETKEGNTLGAGSNWKQVGIMDSYDIKHEIELVGLAPSTSYSFQAQSQDILGNTSSSLVKTFTTASASSIFNVNISDLALTSAKINWETANISTSSLEWGLNPNYGNYLENKDEKVRNHSIVLSNLQAGSAYHYRVRSIEESGTILTSDDYTFSTPNLPLITKYDLGEVKDNSIALTWTSNIPIDINVRYTNLETNDVKLFGKEERTAEHAITLTGLEAGKSYRIEIQGRDEQNNVASIPPFEVQTGLDIAPPELSQIRSQSAIQGGAEDKVQAIISWRTNELSSSQVLWDLSSTSGDKFQNATLVDANLTASHITVITSFKPGTVYRFRVVSVDKFGNSSTSPDYTILTPIRRQSIIQMIVNQFESIFGWVKMIGR